MPFNMGIHTTLTLDYAAVTVRGLLLHADWTFQNHPILRRNAFERRRKFPVYLRIRD